MTTPRQTNEEPHEAMARTLTSAMGEVEPVAEKIPIDMPEEERDLVIGRETDGAPGGQVLPMTRADVGQLLGITMAEGGANIGGGGHATTINMMRGAPTAPGRGTTTTTTGIEVANR